MRKMAKVQGIVQRAPDALLGGPVGTADESIDDMMMMNAVYSEGEPAGQHRLAIELGHAAPMWGVPLPA